LRQAIAPDERQKLNDLAVKAAIESNVETAFSKITQFS